MNNKGWNRRREGKRSLKKAKPKRISLFTPEEVEFLPREEKENEINKRLLIICEGETEEAYFSGLKNNILLKEKFKAVDIHIVGPSHRGNSYSTTILIDNSLKGMVWEAMQCKRKADRDGNPYNEIWIVVDNDERNSYVISNRTLSKVEKVLTVTQATKLAAYYDSFFLSDRHFMDFLQNTIGLSQQTAENVLQLGEKNRIFEEYEHSDPKKQFYKNDQFTYGQQRHQNVPQERDFDETWKNWMLKAYSCRSFEIWLILHFEACKTPFTITKEEEITDESPKNPMNCIHHLWTFEHAYRKGFGNAKNNTINAYDILKPQPFNPKYETEAEAQAVVDKVNTAILNSFWLRNEMEYELERQGGRYYEVNPYTDVNFLLSSLLEKKVTLGKLGTQIEFDGLKITIHVNHSTNEFQVRLINNTQNKGVLINNINKDSFFKILTITENRLHTFSSPEEISNIVYLPPGDETPSVFSVSFFPIPDNNRSYLVFQNNDRGSFLYFWIAS